MKIRSFPKGQREPVDICLVLDGVPGDQVERYEDEMLYSPEELAGILEDTSDAGAYMDPTLAADPEKYAKLIAELYHAKMLDLEDTCRVQIAVFFVTKKDGRLRIIIDARRAKRVFRPPPACEMGSAECWTRVEAPGVDPLYIALEDVKDFFYRLLMPIALRQYFGLPPLDASLLRRAFGDHVPPELVNMKTVFPCLRVLPLGFSWALYLAQEVHKTIFARACEGVPVILDRKAGVTLEGEDTAALIYADNANHAGRIAEKVDEQRQTLSRALHDVGLETHEVEDANLLTESLGVRIDGLAKRSSVTAKRAWRLERSLRALLRGRPVTGREYEKVLGHITCHCLLRRDLFAFLQYSYDFVRRSYNRRQPLWQCVAAEVQRMIALLPFAFTDMSLPWSRESISVDACESGYAVMGAHLTAGEVRRFPRYDERWRFKLQEVRDQGVRGRALQHADVLTDVATARPAYDGRPPCKEALDDSFPEVPISTLDPQKWHCLWAARYHMPEAMHMKEARSVLAGVRHKSETSTSMAIDLGYCATTWVMCLASVRGDVRILSFFVRFRRYLASS